MSRILTEYMADLSPLSKAAPKHILHKYFKKIATKSEVIVVDVLMKNEARNVLVGSEERPATLPLQLWCIPGA